MTTSHVDLEKKSKELKSFVSQFDTPMFLGDISSLIQFISSENPINSLEGLSSPLRQLYYIAALNVTSAIDAAKSLKPQYSNEDWDHIKRLLNEIEAGYEQFFFPKQPNDVNDEDWIIKRMVAMPTFLSYFNQGPLNYEEQVIDRVLTYFLPFNQEIKAKFGLEVKDFIEIYNYIDSLPNKFLDENVNKKPDQQTWEEFADEMHSKGILPPDWQPHLPKHFVNLFEFMYDKGRMHRFSEAQLASEFGKDKAHYFLRTLTCERTDTDFLYYSERNILHTRPIFRVDEHNYQAIDMKQIIHAIYNLLAGFCISSPDKGERFYAHRGEALEDKIEQVFQIFFEGKAQVYRSYYTQDKHEQDLLFLIDGIALIIEAKASKRDEPRRDPEKAYPLILSNFDETIQKGYDQAYRVKGKFIDYKPVQIYKDQVLKRHVVDIVPKKFRAVFSIIVTLERFGQIQTDLSELLQIFDDDEFPWSVGIDDLEVFLLTLKKKGKGVTDLLKFLRMRQELHGKVICSDELDICAGFISGEITQKKAFSAKERFLIPPHYAKIIDDVYLYEGLGFKNEKNMQIKTSGKYAVIGQYKKPYFPN